MEKLTKESFIERLKQVHGDIYDASEINYINARTNVKLFCKKHNIWFESTPDNILNKGYGCPKCRYEKSSEKMRIPLEKIIEKSNQVHNFKYDYSLITEYKNNRVRYPMICPKHGVFYQDFDHHINRKQGCPYCSGNAKRTLESVIEDARKVHGDKYDYSKSVYNGTHKKMCIICHEKDENGIEHGEFWQAPNDHLHGQGCPKCKGKRIWDSRGRLTVNEVKEQFRKVHGEEYDYSLFTEYKNNRTKIPVICKKHGVFYVTPNAHITGRRGCPKCGAESSSEKQRLPIDEVIRRIKKVHGDNYIIPSDLGYRNNQDKVKLICPTHGEFYQTPFNLWASVGCPKCNRSKLEQAMSRFLEENDIEFEEQKKFDWLGNFELDFYLPKQNIAIECQGIQHFKPIKTFGGDEMFKRQIEWDKKKKELCEAHGIKLLYFSSMRVKNQIGYEFPYDVIINENTLKEKIKEED